MGSLLHMHNALLVVVLVVDVMVVHELGEESDADVVVVVVVLGVAAAGIVVVAVVDMAGDGIGHRVVAGNMVLVGSIGVAGK